jgi:hypothetical protein
MNSFVRASLAIAFSAGSVAFVGCSGAVESDTADSASSVESSALEAAENSHGEARGGANRCFETFQACVTAENADVGACRNTLQGCLPARPPHPPECPPPPPPPQGEGGGDCDGGVRPPPPPPSGPRPEGPPPPQGEGGHRPPPPHCARLPLPPPEEVRACHVSLDACIDTADDRQECFQAHRRCMHDAFVRAFRARCDEGLAKCRAESRSCLRLEAICSRGLPPPPPRPQVQ